MLNRASSGRRPADRPEFRVLNHESRLLRYLLAFAVLAVACHRGDRGESVAARDSAKGAAGTDALVLRVPRRGGVPRVTGYPNLDSTVWSGGSAMPAVDRVLAFDDEAGLVAFVDDRGLPGRLD